MNEIIDNLTKMKKAFEPTSDIMERLQKAEDFYWLYRMAKDNPQALEILFLREANILQKTAIDKLLQEREKKNECINGKI